MNNFATVFEEKYIIFLILEETNDCVNFSVFIVWVFLTLCSVKHSKASQSMHQTIDLFPSLPSKVPGFSFITHPV